MHTVQIADPDGQSDRGPSLSYSVLSCLCSACMLRVVLSACGFDSHRPNIAIIISLTCREHTRLRLTEEEIRTTLFITSQSR
jgi:hypothetical protein